MGANMESLEHMHPSSCFSRGLIWAGLAVAAGFMAGCGNVFTPKHKVLVDAIAAPGYAAPAPPKGEAPKPNVSGQSYRLLAKKATVSNTPMQKDVVAACVIAALTNVGMFEAPVNAPPDVFIEVNYGTDAGPRVDPSQRETFLQLSARANPERNVTGNTGPEIWDVRVGVMGVAGRPESAMPLLASALVNYIGQDTKAETKIEIPQNAPTTLAVRETAIKTLEGKSVPRAAEAGGAASGVGNAGAASAAGTPSAAGVPTGK